MADVRSNKVLKACVLSFRAQSIRQSNKLHESFTLDNYPEFYTGEDPHDKD
ncbi:hypothetical protein BARBAKC583_1181 [Bartonella bacilliformis KC583]|uniref:Uncharacterized protein n=1 Tax=Bartonella bacilliformis (strain ATCC 35685 / KC583 / Herrer 020/F12,63) TaxID=360095 RepID=A1UTP4_BARBK|nr:hypothetical protein BARBAKC583_1079 [Bartonella bacilliformis KC583]ABM45553.1 hypothetical protein BARBAKC583_1181 [Bartonella bacilliformis KC583]